MVRLPKIEPRIVVGDRCFLVVDGDRVLKKFRDPALAELYIKDSAKEDVQDYRLKEKRKGRALPGYSAQDVEVDDAPLEIDPEQLEELIRPNKSVRIVIKDEVTGKKYDNVSAAVADAHTSWNKIVRSIATGKEFRSGKKKNGPLHKFSLVSRQRYLILDTYTGEEYENVPDAVEKLGLKPATVNFMLSDGSPRQSRADGQMHQFVKQWYEAPIEDEL